MTFQITGKVTSEDNAEALTVLTYFSTNYGIKIKVYAIKGTDKSTRFAIEEVTFNDMVNTITDLINEYGDGVRLINWEIHYQEI